MSNEELAKEAFKAARSALAEFKSGNKLRPDEAHSARQQSADARIADYREKNEFAVKSVYDQNEWAAEIAKDNAKSAKETGAGNCVEYAVIARDYVLQKKDDAKAAVIGLSMADHAFLAVGIGADDAPVKDMREWGDDVWICDPWAKIVCKAADYPLKWREKLTKWKSKDKMLSLGGNWSEATSKTWWLAVELSDKVAYKI
jgi:hypothetical protein